MVANLLGPFKRKRMLEIYSQWCIEMLKVEDVVLKLKLNSLCCLWRFKIWHMLSYHIWEKAISIICFVVLWQPEYIVWIDKVLKCIPRTMGDKDPMLTLSFDFHENL